MARRAGASRPTSRGVAYARLSRMPRRRRLTAILRPRAGRRLPRHLRARHVAACCAEITGGSGGAKLPRDGMVEEVGLP
jgi:hypothetical protein